MVKIDNKWKVHTIVGLQANQLSLLQEINLQLHESSNNFAISESKIERGFAELYHTDGIFSFFCWNSFFLISTNDVPFWISLADKFCQLIMTIFCIINTFACCPMANLVWNYIVIQLVQLNGLDQLRKQSLVRSYTVQFCIAWCKSICNNNFS